MNLRRKRWWILVVLLAVALAAIYFHRPPPPEPVYMGKPFSAWFKDAEQMTFTDPRAPYVTAIHDLGTNAVPLLAARLRYGNSWLNEFWWQRYQKLPPRLQGYFARPDPPGLSQRTAALLLFETKLSSRAAVPDLIKAYNRNYLKQYHLPSATYVDWSAQLTHPPATLLSNYAGGDTRQWILLTLARDGGEDKEIIPMQLAAVHESGAALRSGVANYLNSDNTNLASAIRLTEPTLVLALTDPASEVRATAADLLIVLAPDHPEIIPPLLKLLFDPEPYASLKAYTSLHQTHLDLETFLPTYDRLIAEQTPQTHAYALGLLFHAAGGMPKLESGLEQSLGSTNALVRAGAAEALGNFGPRFVLAAPGLREHTNASAEPDDRVRRAATEALKKIAPE